MKVVTHSDNNNMQPIQTVPIAEYCQNMIDFHNRVGYTKNYPEPDYMKIDSEEDQLEGCVKKNNTPEIAAYANDCVLKHNDMESMIQCQNEGTIQALNCSIM